MNIQQTLRLIDDIYSFRHNLKTGPKAQMPLSAAVVHYLVTKLKNKAKVD
jgi:hypothetical protein